MRENKKEGGIFFFFFKSMTRHFKEKKEDFIIRKHETILVKQTEDAVGDKKLTVAMDRP